MTPIGFPHSDIHDSCGYTHLIMAFRSVSRLSSAVDAKAFTMCPFSLLKPAGDTEMLTLSHRSTSFFLVKPRN